MNPADFADLEQLLVTWVHGGGAKLRMPAAWQPVLADLAPEEAQLRALVLAGQALQMVASPRPDPTLEVKPALPTLALPTLPETARRHFRRAWEESRELERRPRILHLLARRGWVVHPFDWLPVGPQAELPEVYAPWRAWLGGEAVWSAPDGAELTDENWDAWAPAERIAALAARRREQPEEVVTLYQLKFPTEAADARVRLLEVLAINLSPADQPFLESLLKDRSSKVETLARQLLARLGVASLAEDDAQELATFFVVGQKGFFQRQKTVAPRALKNQAQGKRRNELLAQADLASLARVLGLTPDVLIAGWQFNDDPNADQSLASLLARTGSDAQMAAFVDRALETGLNFEAILRPLLERLTPTQRREVTTLVISRGLPFITALFWAGPELGCFPYALLSRGAAWASLFEELRKEVKDGAGPGRAVADGLAWVALLSDASTARQLLTEVEALGFGPFDPRLALLQLNAALPASPL